MFAFLTYLAQSALCLAALYLLYKVTMSRETLHRLNRVLLLGSILLSALLPLCRVKIVKEFDPAPAVTAVEVNDVVVAEVAELGIDYIALLKDLAVLLFIVGAAFMLVRLVVGIYSVLRLIHSGRMSVIEEDVTLTVVSELSSPFSWFGHIVASEKDMQEYRPMILSHELAHIRLRHSWDVLLVDVALCLWWFNPAMWLFRRELQSLHEYQADDAVLSEGIDAKTYQLLLIKRAVGSRLHSVANCLNHSNLKKRITMMCRKTSSRWAATKALLVVPMVAVALGAFATTVYVPREVQSKGNEKIGNEQETSFAIRSVLKITDEKLLLNGEEITAEELQERVMGLVDDIVLQVDNLTPMGDVADVKEILRANADLKITYESMPEKSDPIIIVDGVIVSAEEMSKIDPNEIHSVAVYKDFEKVPAGLNLSKEEAKNGVIVITTKKGASEAAGLQQRRPMNSEQQQAMHRLADSARAKGHTPQELKGRMADAKLTINPSSNGVVAAQAEFAGGDYRQFRAWVQERLRYPKEAKGDGEVFVTFVVKANGEVGDVDVIGEADKALAEEVVRVVKSSPTWKPATKQGKAVDAKYGIEFTFAKSVQPAPVQEAFLVVEQMPTFEGGDINHFRAWIGQQIHYPAEALAKKISGRVIVSFVVEKDGSMTEAQVLRTPDTLLSQEVLRVLAASPKWQPGMQRGEVVRVKYTVPIDFTLPAETDK